MRYMLDNICIHMMKHTPKCYEKNLVKLITFLLLINVLSFDDAAAMEYGIIRADMQKKVLPIGQMNRLMWHTQGHAIL